MYQEKEIKGIFGWLKNADIRSPELITEGTCVGLHCIKNVQLSHSPSSVGFPVLFACN